MKQFIRQCLSGTPLEGLARSFYRGLRGDHASTGDLSERYDTETASVMERVLERRSNCIDVGCHRGTILDLMLRCAPEGEHHA